jgi:hypothetical protein
LNLRALAHPQKTEQTLKLDTLKYLTSFFLVLILPIALSCSEVMKVVNSLPADNPLTTPEIIAGLKQALQVGTDSSVARLSKIDGYFGDMAVKILLPPEANTITRNLSRLPGGEKLVNDVILRINRAAEDAAKEAAPVFVTAITGMTITDGLAILKGGDTAATEYLKANTSRQLFQLYQPKIKVSLDKKLIGNISTNESWNKLTSEWNKVANSMVGQLAGFKPVNVKLDDYLTQKGLDGLFLKIGIAEKKIRTDVSARVTNLLKRVFGANIKS